MQDISSEVLRWRPVLSKLCLNWEKTILGKTLDGMYLKDTSDGATHAVIDAAEQQGRRTERLT